MGVGPRVLLGTVLLVMLILPGLSEAASDLRFGKIASLTSVDPGDNLTWTLWVDNVGADPAQRLWVNESLPPAVAYVGDNAATAFGAALAGPPSISGGFARYEFTGVAPGNHSFQIWTRVLGPPIDGYFFRNFASFDHMNDTGVPVPTEFREAGAFIRLANLSVEPRAPARVTPSSTFDHRIWYNNTGGADAGSVLLNVTLPPAVAFVSVSGDGASGCGGVLRWVNCTIPLVPTIGSRSLVIRSALGTGAPLGSTLTANVSAFYVADDDGSFSLSSEASVSYVVESETILELSMFPDAEVVPPGGVVNVTAWLNSTGSLPAPSAWLNVTLPPAATLLRATPEPTAGPGIVRWALASVAGSNRFSLEIHVGDTIPAGTVFPVDASADYLDTGLRRMPSSRGSTSLLVQTGLPDVVLTLGASRLTVPAGGTTSLTVDLTNTGARAATAVVLDLEVPPEVLVDSARPAYTTPRPGLFRFALDNLTPGQDTVTVTLRLRTGTARGTAFFIDATVRYADATHGALRPRQDRLRLLAGPPEVPGLPLAMVAAAVLAAVVALLALYGTVSRLRRGKPKVDEVFLLHRDGLLIRHASRLVRKGSDSDILSGLLIAVQNFINESFIGKDWEHGREGLDELNFGKYRIAIVRGKHVVLAAVVSGQRPEEAHRQMRVAMKDIEMAIGPVMEAWDGDMEKVAGSAVFVRDLLAGAYEKRRGD